MNQAAAGSLWHEATEKVKDQTMHPSLWRALESGVGVAVDGDMFVVGFTAAEYAQSSLISSVQHRLVVERALAQVLGKPAVRIKTIEGTTFQDYERVKRLESASDAERRAVLHKKVSEAVKGHSWDSVIDSVSRLHSQTRLRQCAHIKARFMREALVIISKAVDENYGDASDDATERALARVIEKVASLVDAPSVYVANELWRIREGK